MTYILYESGYWHYTGLRTQDQISYYMVFCPYPIIVDPSNLELLFMEII